MCDFTGLPSWALALIAVVGVSGVLFLVAMILLSRTRLREKLLLRPFTKHRPYIIGMGNGHVAPIVTPNLGHSPAPNLAIPRPNMLLWRVSHCSLFLVMVCV